MVGPIVKVKALRERLRNCRANSGNGEVVCPDEVLPPKPRATGQKAVEEAAREPGHREARIYWDDDLWRPL
jgi:hypothetical protein